MLIDLIKANRSYRGYDHNRAVTKDEVVAAARRLSLDTVYFLKGVEG